MMTPGPTDSDFEIKGCSPEEKPRWAAFLDRNFGYAQTQSYSIDFAPLFEPSALDRARLLYKDGEIVASASAYPVVALSPHGRTRLTIVGAVATDERFRGQGCSRAVLADLERAAAADGCAGLVLWSDKAEFYSKLGYVELGHQEIFSLAELPRPSKVARGTPVYGWDWPQVRTLYERHPSRVERSDAHWEALAGITSCTRVQWVDDHGRVLAYLGFDRGHDLKGIVHEWGGAPEALLSLLWMVLQARPELMWLSSACLADPVSPLLGEPVHQGALALFKPLMPGIAAEALSDVWFWGLDSL